MLTFFLKTPRAGKSSKYDSKKPSRMIIGFNAPTREDFRIPAREMMQVTDSSNQYLILQIQPQWLAEQIQAHPALKNFIQFHPGFDYPYALIFAVPKDDTKSGSSLVFEKNEIQSEIDASKSVTRQYTIHFCSQDEFKKNLSAIINIFQKCEFHNQANHVYQPKKVLQTNLGEYLTVLSGGSSIHDSQKRPHTKEELHTLHVPNPTPSALWMIGFLLLTAIFLTIGLVALGGVIPGVTTPLAIAIGTFLFSSTPALGVYLGVTVAAAIATAAALGGVIYNAIEYYHKKEELAHFNQGFVKLSVKPAPELAQEDDESSCCDFPLFSCFRTRPDPDENDSDSEPDADPEQDLGNEEAHATKAPDSAP